MKPQLKLYLSLILLTIATTMFAQVRFGAKAGIGRTNYKDIHVYSKPRYGLNAGIVALQPFSRYDYLNFIQYELNYVSHGEKNGDLKRHVNYLALPIMYKRYFTEKENDIFIEGGLQFAYAIYNDFDKFPIIPLNNDYDKLSPGKKSKALDNSDNHVLNKFDLSLGFGGGISFKRQFEIGIRYNYGLTDSFKYKYHNNNFNNSSLLALSLTYFFNEY